MANPMSQNHNCLKVKHLHNEPVLTTSDVSRRLGFGVSVTFLKSCGLSPMLEHGTGTFWRANDLPLICVAIARHCQKLADGGQS